MSDLLNNCLKKIKKLFAEDDTVQKNTRIESAKITSNRLQALQRMRDNSATTPDYKLQQQQEPSNARTAPTNPQKRQQAEKKVDLDFGMEIGRA